MKRALQAGWQVYREFLVSPLGVEPRTNRLRERVVNIRPRPIGILAWDHGLVTVRVVRRIPPEIFA